MRTPVRNGLCRSLFPLKRRTSVLLTEHSIGQLTIVLLGPMTNLVRSRDEIQHTTHTHTHRKREFLKARYCEKLIRVTGFNILLSVSAVLTCSSGNGGKAGPVDCGQSEKDCRNGGHAPAAGQHVDGWRVQRLGRSRGECCRCIAAASILAIYYQFYSSFLNFISGAFIPVSLVRHSITFTFSRRLGLSLIPFLCLPWYSICSPITFFKNQIPPFSLLIKYTGNNYRSHMS